MFEAFARLVRRVSSSTLCSEGPWRQFSQSADAWTSFYGWWPKRRYFSSSKMRIPAKCLANPRASSKPPAQETDTREKAAPTRFATTTLVRPVLVEALPRGPVSYGSAQF